MSASPLPVRPDAPKIRPDETVPLSVGIYRYFFYVWLFKDADVGSELERSAALRHNQEQARWLPVYLFRWSVLGMILLCLEQVAEAVSGDSLVSAALAVMLIGVVMFYLLTAVFWAFLSSRRQAS